MTLAHRTIESDLRALAEDTDRAAPELAETRARIMGEGSPYRDQRPGAEARQRALFDRRLIEVAFAPLALERVYVHRVGRATAGAAALAAGVIVMVAVLDPWTAGTLMALFRTPFGVLAPVMVTFAALGGYLAGVILAERHYERTLRASLAGETIGLEVAELERARPLAEVRRLVARVDGVAIALPLAGATLTIGLCGILAAFGFMPLRHIHLAARDDVRSIALIVSLVVGLAAWLGVVCSRERRALERPALLAVVEHWGAAVASVVAGVFALWYGLRVVEQVRFLNLAPDQGGRVLLVASAVLAVLLPVACGLLWLRRREQRRLAADRSQG